VARVPRKQRQLADSVANEVVNRAVTMMQAPLVEELQQRMTASTGRRRTHSWRTLLTVMLIDALERPGELHCTRACDVAHRLSPSQRARVGLSQRLTYRQLTGAVESLGRAATETADPVTGELRSSVPLSDLLTSLVRAPIPDDLLGSRNVAIDATDLESHYSPHGRNNTKRGVPKPQGRATAKDPSSKPPRRRKGGDLPILGADGRTQHTVDPDAREGYRAGKNLKPKETFFGYNLHIAVGVPPEGERAQAALAQGLVICPAGADSDRAGLQVIDALTRQGAAVNRICVDRGYSYRLAMGWARELQRRGIDQTIDLHRTQRTTHPGPVPGTIFVDGHLFIDSLPRSMRDPGGFPQMQTVEDRLKRIAEYDNRIPYAFSRLGRPDRERGTQRYRGPAVTGKVRCPNNPASMRLDPASRPTTNCAGRECYCSRTITLGPDDFLRERQDHLYGTTKWAKDYGRRNHVESLNASLKTHHGGLRRGGIRVQTLQRTGLLAALVLAATNVRILTEAYGRDISAPAPPNTTDPQPQAAGRAGRTPRRPRTPKRGTGPHRAKDPPPRTPTDTTDWLPATKAHKC